MITYKIIQYKCNHKYLRLPGVKLISKCPICKTTQKTVTTFCRDCEEKIVDVPKAGHRRRRCTACEKVHHAAICKEAHDKKYRHRTYFNGKAQYSTKETQKETAERIINEVFNRLSLKFVPVMK